MELIVAERDWRPQEEPKPLRMPRLVRVQIAAAEVGLRGRIQQTGGRWDPQRGVWAVRYDQVVAWGLTTRMGEPARVERV